MFDLHLHENVSIHIPIDSIVPVIQLMLVLHSLKMVVHFLKNETVNVDDLVYFRIFHRNKNFLAVLFEIITKAWRKFSKQQLFFPLEENKIIVSLA